MDLSKLAKGPFLISNDSLDKRNRRLDIGLDGCESRSNLLNSPLIFECSRMLFLGNIGVGVGAFLHIRDMWRQERNHRWSLESKVYYQTIIRVD